MYSFTREAGRQDAMRIYLMCGGAEGQGTINDMIDMQDTLLQAGFTEDELSLTVIPGGQHNETLWSGDFGDAYKWLFASFTNNIIEPLKVNIIRFFPNPTGDKLTIPADFPDKCDSLQVIDMMGKQVLKFAPFTRREVDVSGLAPGLYLVSLSVNGKYLPGEDCEGIAWGRGIHVPCCIFHVVFCISFSIFHLVRLGGRQKIAPIKSGKKGRLCHLQIT